MFVPFRPVGNARIFPEEEYKIKQYFRSIFAWFISGTDATVGVRPAPFIEDRQNPFA